MNDQQKYGECELCDKIFHSWTEANAYARHDCGCKLLCMMCAVKHDRECPEWKVFMEEHRKRCDEALRIVVARIEKESQK